MRIEMQTSRIKTQSSRDTVVIENRVSILDLIVDSRFMQESSANLQYF